MYLLYVSRGFLWGLQHTVMTIFLQNIWSGMMGHWDFSMFLFSLLSLRFLAQLFSWSRASFSGIPPLVYVSIWTSGPGRIVGVEALSGLIAVWCSVGRRARLGRRWGKTSCPRSLLSLPHLFSVSPTQFFSLFPSSLSLYMTTQNDGSPAWLINW